MRRSLCYLLQTTPHRLRRSAYRRQPGIAWTPAPCLLLQTVMAATRRAPSPAQVFSSLNPVPRATMSSPNPALVAGAPSSSNSKSCVAYSSGLLPHTAPLEWANQKYQSHRPRHSLGPEVLYASWAVIRRHPQRRGGCRSGYRELSRAVSKALLLRKKTGTGLPVPGGMSAHVCTIVEENVCPEEGLS